MICSSNITTSVSLRPTRVRPTRVGRSDTEVIILLLNNDDACVNNNFECGLKLKYG